MEKEIFLSGYCRCLDASRMVEVICEEGNVEEVDCGYFTCIHRSNCSIAKEIDKIAHP